MWMRNVLLEELSLLLPNTCGYTYMWCDSRKSRMVVIHTPRKPPHTFCNEKSSYYIYPVVRCLRNDVKINIHGDKERYDYTMT